MRSTGIQSFALDHQHRTGVSEPRSWQHRRSLRRFECRTVGGDQEIGSYRRGLRRKFSGPMDPGCSSGKPHGLVRRVPTGNTYPCFGPIGNHRFDAHGMDGSDANAGGVSDISRGLRSLGDDTPGKMSPFYPAPWRGARIHRGSQRDPISPCNASGTTAWCKLIFRLTGGVAALNPPAPFWHPAGMAKPAKEERSDGRSKLRNL